MFRGVATLLMFLLAGPQHFCTNDSNWIDETFPHKFNANDFIFLPKSNLTGCGIMKCPLDLYYYIYSDSCTAVPTLAPITGIYMHLSGTRIKVIHAGDFANVPQLITLNIETNIELSEIEPGAFVSLSHLTNLSITDNSKLGGIKPDVFTGLDSLVELKYMKNNMHRLPELVISLSPISVPSLIVLDLSQNPLEIINSTDLILMKGSKVEQLSLVLCGLSNIDENSLAPLTSLRSLDLGTNNLVAETLARLVLNLTKTAENFTRISVAGNLLHDAPTTFLKAVAVTNISDLDMKENHFDLLQRDLFPFMPNLKKIDLSAIMAVDVHEDTFNPEVLPNLTSLIVARNKFPGLLKNLLLPKLRELDISDNSYENPFTAPLFKVNEFIFDGADNLKVLSLAKNPIYHLKKFMLYGLINLEVLVLSNCTIYLIDHQAFLNLTRLKHLDFSYNKSLLNGSLSANTFTGLINLESLQLDYCDMTRHMDYDIFKGIPNLKYLTLRGNSLAAVNPVWFEYLPNLTQLDLAYNDIAEWNDRLFTFNQNLELVSLLSNRIRYLTESMLDDFACIDRLDLRENQWDCSCQSVFVVRDYLFSRNVTYASLSLNTTKNYCFTPRRLSDEEMNNFIQESLEQQLCSNIKVSFIVCLCIAIIGFVGLFTLLLYYTRWHIRYWIFLFRQAMRYNYFPGKRKPNPTINGKYKYDAFVSYSHEDRNFVVRLVSMLETQPPYYTLCVFERDFSVGEVIADSVLECLSSSRRTILVLSDSFARSTWCLWEMDLAQHKRLFFKDEETEPLVIIKIGEIMDRHMTPTLRYLIKSRVYLQWNQDPKKQKQFWLRLREALTPPKVQL